MTPEVSAKFGRHLEDDEFVGPGREPAIASELAQLGRDGQQRVGRGLVGEVLKFLLLANIAVTVGGRLVPEDVIGLIRYLCEHAASTTTA
jgi:hypothetical protein